MIRYKLTHKMAVPVYQLRPPCPADFSPEKKAHLTYFYIRYIVHHNQVYYSAPQCSHCKSCTSYGISVRLSVRPSVTRRYCVKTTARSTVQFALSDSKMCLVLYKLKKFPRDDPFPLKSWLQVTYPLLTATSLDTFCFVAPQR